MPGACRSNRVSGHAHSAAHSLVRMAPSGDGKLVAYAVIVREMAQVGEGGWPYARVLARYLSVACKSSCADRQSRALHSKVLSARPDCCGSP